MTTYLLRWNPEKWPEQKYAEYVEQFRRGERLRWSCGNTKKIVAGDRFFLQKVGPGLNGIIGSGTIAEAPLSGPHYDSARAAEGNEALYVMVQFEYLCSTVEVPPIARQELDTPPFDSDIWRAQGSGKTIPTDIADALEALWASRVQLAEFVGPDEVEGNTSQYKEGAVTQKMVNAYERNSEARRKCIEHWKCYCAVCGFNFEYAYGPLAKGYIHVHHLLPLESIGKEYVVDPVADLRPVCPNCHAMLHKEKPPLTIEALRAIVESYR